MFYFGVDYYPEQWPEERWSEDARLMAEAGFNVVRLAEFAWSKMEPEAGYYDFDWLDRAISVLTAHDMRIVLGTPTASPPAWLMIKHPESFRVREDGRRVTYGNRREYCPNSQIYQAYSRQIVTCMAEHYADHPAVVGWQVDNEFGDRCFCPVCASAFQTWLQQRYASLDDLNQKWGAIFWSHTYNNWAEIPLPLTTGGSPNPGLALDFFRFASDSYVAYQQMQIDILRQKCPRHFITHNFMGFNYDRLNYFDLARTLDFVAWDNYPRMQWNMQAEVDPSQGALAADTMRGLKRQNFWVVEQQAGPGGWEMVSVPPRPGELRLWAYQAIAHGADAILFFRWRTARFGTEQYWHGLLDHDGRPSRRYEEIKRMGGEMKKAGERIYGSVVKPSVAMLLSYDSRFAFQIQGNNPLFSYSDHFHQLYHALYHRHVSVDIVAPTADLSAYKLVLAPALHLICDKIATNLQRFVHAGGVLVLTPRTGVKDESNAVVEQRLPGLLTELSGVEVDEYISLAPRSGNGLRFTLPELATTQPLTVTTWCDVLKANGATVVARYTQDFFAGQPAITVNNFGQGKVVYIGTLGDKQVNEMLIGWLLGLANVPTRVGTLAGIEVAERWQGEQRLLFILNHGEQEKVVTLDGRYKNLLDNSVKAAYIEGNVTVAPRDVLVLADTRIKR